MSYLFIQLLLSHSVGNVVFNWMLVVDFFSPVMEVLCAYLEIEMLFWLLFCVTVFRANAQQPKLFVGMILILIFAEALALYGLIVGIILSSRAGQSRAD
jgi:hypothetical protein